MFRCGLSDNRLGKRVRLTLGYADARAAWNALARNLLPFIDRKPLIGLPFQLTHSLPRMSGRRTLSHVQIFQTADL